MAIFLLDTDVLSSSSDSFKNLANKFYQLASIVDSYDIDSSDFNFGSVKSLIVNNIHACGIKSANTAGYIDKVVEGHTELQQKEKYYEVAPGDTNTKPTTPQTTPSSTPSTTPSVHTTSPPINLYYRPSVQTVPVAPTVAAASTVVAATSKKEEKEVEEEFKEDEEDITEEREDKPRVIKSEVKSISHEEVDTESLNSAGRYMFNHSDFKYDDSGYAKIGNRYVISCDKEFGNVGDEIEFTMKDGLVVKCIIGQINEENTNNINFFVNSNWKENSSNNLPINFADAISKIVNNGFNNKYSIKPDVCSALDWAYDLANGNINSNKYDDYLEINKYGYSSFVLSSYKSSGISIDEKEGEDIKDTLVNSGFEKMSNDINVSDLKPGDVLIDENNQLKMYYGDGKFLEEYGDVTNTSSKFGVRLVDYSDHTWKGILRYTGKKESIKTESVQENDNVWRGENF